MARATRCIKVLVCKHCGKEFATKGNRKYCSKECSGVASRLSPNTGDTICWDCKKATNGDLCPWAENFTPVEGWEATPTRIISAYNPEGNGITSYCVHKCPLFERG